MVKEEKKQTLFIPGQLPGMNEMIDASRRIFYSSGGSSSAYSKMKKVETSRIALLIKSSGIKKAKAIYLDITWVETNKRRDPDNIAAGVKFILDALQEAEIIKNDGWKQIVGWRNNFIVGTKAGVIITIISKEGLKQ